MQAVRAQHRHFIRGIGIVDETSCGPLCQHPACWKSNERQERGLPNVAIQENQHYTEEDDLPAVTVYNMLEDYGESPYDRYPRGKPTEDFPSPPVERKGRSKHKHRKTSLTLSDSFLKDVKPREKAPVSVKNVEVQELFDLDDLSNTWEQTFLSKQYYVWVPNPNYKPKSADDRRTRPEAQKITPRDMTEELVPRSIEEAREASTMRRNTHNRSKSPFRYYGASPRQPTTEEVDIDGINELLDLPREVLMKVLDHCQPSDLRCKERIIDIVRRFMPNYETNPARQTSAKSHILKQTRVRLHDGKLKNVRKPTAMAECKPVFQLDTDTDVSVTNKEEDVQPDSSRNREFGKYTHVLPAIGEKAHSMDNFKLSSVSLGLPELPSGVRTTRAFNYRNLDLDFTLGPSVPVTARSTVTSDGTASEHGTTMNVNLPSHRSVQLNCPSDRQEDPCGTLHTIPEPPVPLSLKHDTKTIPAERFICPDPPLGTPMSNGPQRPLTKSSMLRRELTMDSVTEESSGKPSTPPLEKATPRVPPVCIPTENSAATNPHPHSQGMKKHLPEGTGGSRGAKKMSNSRQGVLFHKEVPPQPPSSPQSGLGETSSLSPVPTITPLAAIEPTKESLMSSSQGGHHYSLKELQDLGTSDRSSPVSSTDAWPTDVVEKSVPVSRAATQASDRLPMTPETLNSTAVGFDARSEKSRLSSIPQSEVSSVVSDPSLVKDKLTRKGSRESPGPPPPSPEPKDIPSNPAIRSGRFSSKSRDSLAMAPVFEEGEESEDDVSISAYPPQSLYNSQQFVTGLSSAVSPDALDVDSPGGRQSSPRRVSGVVNIDMDGQEQDKSIAANTHHPGLETSNVSHDNISNSNNVDVDYEKTGASPPVELSGDYPVCPPETDGRSSAYLTERDRRFTPEGLDTTFDSNDNFPAANFELDSPRDKLEDSMAGGCMLEEDDEDFVDESDIEMPFDRESTGSADRETPYCEKASSDIQKQEETGENAISGSEDEGQSPVQANKEIFDSNDEGFAEQAAHRNDFELSRNHNNVSNTHPETDSALEENVESVKDSKSDILEVPVAESMENCGPEENMNLGKASEEPLSTRLDADTAKTEDNSKESCLEMPMPQSVLGLVEESEIDDSGHSTPPQYTETSDRGSGGDTVTGPTDELPSYIN